MNAQSSHDEQLFAHALALPPAQRGSFLAQACGADVELLARLEALVAAHDSTESLMAVTPVPRVTTSVEESAGDAIGRYKLLQKIGEGGCGVVWMAGQEEPVRRRVALKVIKLGMDTKAVVARFEAERQALAMMDHPNIAKVHDAGSTDTGRPFFVMELVRGIPITKYCDENHLTPKERLELFIKVCQAIQHAHQKGVIHRDIKPSNILVTVNDGQPTPKVIDFGIAKATQGKLTDATVFTAFEQFIGTPVYMSPEQAEMSSLDIDTRSDIYSLGVLLYELLTGRPPFDPMEFARAGLDQIRRQIREVEPDRPSARLRTLDDGERTTIARLRNTAPGLLSILLRGDLDWIVMRCIEKDRTRRYETANGLASDIQRYLSDEPVIARPPNTSYLLRKLIRRHRVAFSAGVSIFAALAIGLAVAMRQYVREKAARERATAAEHEQIKQREAAEAATTRAVAAEAAQNKLREESEAARASEAKQRVAAEAEAERSQQVTRFLQQMLSKVGPNVAQGRDTVLLREMLEDTVKRLNSGELVAQPLVEADLRRTIGEVYLELREFPQAEAMFRAAMALLAKAHGNEDRSLLRLLFRLAQAYAGNRQYKEAESTYREAMGLRQRLGDRPLDEMRGLQGVLMSQQRYSEGEALAFERHRLIETGDGVRSTRFADSLHNLASVIYRRGVRADEADAYLEQAVDILDQKRGTDSLDITGPLYMRARIARDELRFADARQHLERALRIRQKALGETNPKLAVDFGKLADLLLHGGKFDEAVEIFRRQIELMRKNPGNSNLALPLCSLSGALLRAKRAPEAEEAAREAVAVARATQATALLPFSLRALAEALEAQEKLAEAEECRREVLTRSRQQPSANKEFVGAALNDLGMLLRRSGKTEEAQALAQEAQDVAATLKFETPASVVPAIPPRLAPATPSLRQVNSSTTDLIKITSVNPRTAVPGETHRFIVRIHYSLTSRENAAIDIGFNHRTQTAYSLITKKSVTRGQGDIELEAEVRVPAWGGTPGFEAYAILSEDPRPPTWRPITSDRKPIPVP